MVLSRQLTKQNCLSSTWRLDFDSDGITWLVGELFFGFSCMARVTSYTGDFRQSPDLLGNQVWILVWVSSFDFRKWLRVGSPDGELNPEDNHLWGSLRGIVFSVDHHTSVCLGLHPENDT